MRKAFLILLVPAAACGPDIQAACEEDAACTLVDNQPLCAARYSWDDTELRCVADPRNPIEDRCEYGERGYEIHFGMCVQSVDVETTCDSVECYGADAIRASGTLDGYQSIGCDWECALYDGESLQVSLGYGRSGPEYCWVTEWVEVHDCN